MVTVAQLMVMGLCLAGAVVTWRYNAVSNAAALMVLALLCVWRSWLTWNAS